MGIVYTLAWHLLGPFLTVRLTVYTIVVWTEGVIQLVLTERWPDKHQQKQKSHPSHLRSMEQLW